MTQPSDRPRALICIPHFFRKTAAADTGMASRDSIIAADDTAKVTRRMACVEACLFQLRALFDPTRQWAACHHTQTLAPVTSALAMELDIVVVTNGQDHLLDTIALPEGFYRHCPVDDPPHQLGYACHRIMADAKGHYDWYGYMEDDLILYDPWFFRKLALFNRIDTPAADKPPLLQPHRWEDSLGAAADRKALFTRCYPDYELTDQPVYAGPVIELEFMGVTMHLEPSRDPHAGCFFLTESQLGIVMAEPTFLDPTEVWTTPLDSAATLAIARAFRVYKPMLNSTAFLEIRHGAPLMLDQLHPPDPTKPGSGGPVSPPPKWEF